MAFNLSSHPSETRHPLKDVLKRADGQLEKARNASSSAKALKFCVKAETLLEKAEVIASNDQTGGRTSNEDIANAYYKHGKLLEELGQHSKAQESLGKAEKWGYVHVVTQQTDSQPIHTTSSIRASLCPPAALWSTPRISVVASQGILDFSNASESTPPELIQNKPLNETKDQIHVDPISFLLLLDLEDMRLNISFRRKTNFPSFEMAAKAWVIVIGWLSYLTAISLLLQMQVNPSTWKKHLIFFLKLSVFISQKFQYIDYVPLKKHK